MKTRKELAAKGGPHAFYLRSASELVHIPRKKETFKSLLKGGEKDRGCRDPGLWVRG